MNLTALFSLITVALNFVMMLFKDLKITPEQAKLNAINAIIKDMEADVLKFNKALADNNGDDITRQFNDLLLRTKQISGDSGQPGDHTDSK